MIIYSVMPQEVIFENFDQMEKADVREVKMGGITMLVEPTGPYEGKIVRLISPDPQDYLNPSYAPGQTIYFRPQFS